MYSGGAAASASTGGLAVLRQFRTDSALGRWTRPDAGFNTWRFAEYHLSHPPWRLKLAIAQGHRRPMKIMQAFRFEAAHWLPKVPVQHRCHRMHGHSYRIEVMLEGQVDETTGFLVDFFDIEAAFAALLKRLDHHCLNEIEGLENPTAENIAAWIWRHIKPSLANLAAVRVFETPDCWAEYDG